MCGNSIASTNDVDGRQLPSFQPARAVNSQLTATCVFFFSIGMTMPHCDINNKAMMEQKINYRSHIRITHVPCIVGANYVWEMLCGSQYVWISFSISRARRTSSALDPVESFSGSFDSWFQSFCESVAVPRYDATPIGIITYLNKLFALGFVSPMRREPVRTNTYERTYLGCAVMVACPVIITHANCHNVCEWQAQPDETSKRGHRPFPTAWLR